MKRLFTSESVTEGHPDKVCDQISDAILDAILEQDPNGRVACETTTTTGYAMVMGEISTNCYVDIPKVVRGVIDDIGYNNAEYGFDAKTCAVLSAIDEQSGDIAMGVNDALEHKEGSMNDAIEAIGAGDQGMMFGYACTETPEYMPMPIALAHKLTYQLAKVRKDGTLRYLRPDGKSQVTVEYDGDKVKRVDTVLISTKYFVNPTGRFVIGGPHGDSGLTGRKIIVDTYGGYAHHGGGAFSGKDPTKVDRSATYAARYVAKNLVAAGFATKLEIQLAYAIGVAKPVSVMVDTFGTGVMDDDKIAEIVNRHFDLRPAAIIRDLDLRRPIYRKTAAYGHFGRTDVDFTWEHLDKVEELKKEL